MLDSNSKHVGIAVLLALAALSCAVTGPAHAAQPTLEFICEQASAELGTSVEAAPRRTLPEIAVPAGASLALRFPNGPGQYLPCALEVRSEGRLLSSLPLGSYLSFSLTVATVPGGLQRGAQVQQESVAWSRTTLAPGQEVVTDMTQLAGLAARGYFAPGARLKLSRLISPPALPRGCSVQLLLRSGSVLVTAAGTALSDSYLGQVLNVRRTADGAILRGILKQTDSGLVVVIE